MLPVRRLVAGAFSISSRPQRWQSIAAMVDYRKTITIESGKRGGKPCIRGIGITVGEVLGGLAAGMSHQQIIDDYPDLAEEDIRACLAHTADKERHRFLRKTRSEPRAYSIGNL